MPDGGGRLPADLTEAVDPVFRVIARRSPLVQDRIEIQVPVGTTIAQAMELAFKGRADPVIYSHGHAKLGEYELPSSVWAAVKPKQGTTVQVLLVPQGNTGRMLLTIAIVVAAAFAAPYLAGALLPAAALAVAAGTASVATAAALSATTALITAGIAFAGNMLLNALIPIRPPQLQTRQASATYSISGGRNSASPWGAIPVHLGASRYAPLYGARAYTEASGNDQWLRMIFIWGYGPLRIADMKIGNTAIEEFDDVQIITREGLIGDPAPGVIYPGQVIEQAFNHEMSSEGTWVVETTDPDCDEISVDWSYPRGLVKFNKKGKPEVTSSVIEIEYKLVSDSVWTHFGTFDIEEKKQSPFRVGKVWTVARGQYDVRLRCTEDESETQSQTWTALRTIRHEPPFTFSKPLAFTEMRIKASGQLNGVVDNLTAMVYSRCKAWNGSVWTDNVETQRPHDLYRYTLQHPALALPRSDAQIDLAGIQAWGNYCIPRGLKFNMVRDTTTSVQECLTDIAAVGRANPARPNGKWSVIVDKSQTEIADIFTDRNTWDFVVEREYRTIPQAWRVRFNDETSEFKQNERIIYREGVTPETATDFETMEFRGITDPALLWKEGQRRFRELEARADTYSFMTTWESLRVVRGDLIKAQAEVTRWGLSAGRVKEVVGSIVVLDDEITMDGVSNYSLRWRRSADGGTVVRQIVPNTGTVKHCRLAPGEMPSAGDLWMFGLVNFEAHDLVVKSVEPSDELTAKITAVEYAQPLLDEADDLTPPEWIPRQFYPTPGIPSVPRIVGIASGNSQQVVGEDGTVYSPVTVGVTAGFGADTPTASFRVRHRPVGSLFWTVVDLVGTNSVEILGYSGGDAIEVAAQAVAGDRSKASSWTTPPTPHTVGVRTQRPPDVITFGVARLNDGTRRYTWILDDPEADGPPPDLAGFQIRFRSGTNVLWGWSDLTPLNDGLLTSSPYDNGSPGAAGTYTFAIAAFNTSGLMSSAAKIITATLGPGMAPPAPAITTASGAVGNTNPFVQGTATPGLSVRVIADGVINQTVTADGSGNWSATLTGLAFGSHQIVAQQVDAFGVPSSPSTPINLVVTWYDPAAAGEIDFIGKRFRILGTDTTVVSASDWAGIFNSAITASPTIVTMADGSLKSIPINTLPVSDLGLEVWEPRTNRCTNYNAAPTTGAPGNANATLSGDAAATLTMVTDTTNLNAGKLAALVSAGILSGTVYCLNNSAGVADAFVTFGGTVTDTTAHRGFIWARGSAGRLEIGGTSIVTITAAGTTWTRFEGTRTPAVGTEQMRVAAPAGATIYFILNQLEKGAIASASIVVAGASATRNAPLFRRTMGADWNTVEGFIATVMKQNAGSANNGVILQILAPDGNNTHFFQHLGLTTLRAASFVAGSGTTGAALDKTTTSGVERAAVYGFKASDFAWSLDGGSLSTKTGSGTVPSSGSATLTVSTNSAAGFNGVIRRVKWGVAKPTNAEIQRKAGWVLAA